MTIKILNDFAQKKATPHQVLRELIAYDGWFAPLVWASAALKTDVFDRICVCGTSSTLPDDLLWMFTSADELMEAQERYQTIGNLGPYAGPLKGLPLFEQLPRGLRAVEINPKLRPEDGFYVKDDAIDTVRSLAKAVALERVLDGKGEDTVDRLIDFDRYILLAAPNGSPATAVGAAGMKNPVMAFTAPDAIEPVLRATGPALAQHRPVVLSGEQLFSRFDQLGVDGVLLFVDPNVMKGKPLRAEVCHGLAESIHGRAEVARLEALARAHEEK